MNWRKPVLRLLLNLKNTLEGKPCATTRFYDRLLELEFADREVLLREQQRKLEELLLHAHRHVPYYTPLLEQSGVVRNNRVHLDSFTKIPFLTKQIMREHHGNLTSRIKCGGRVYHNTSGGSTGEPVDFVQDTLYRSVNWATALFYNHVLGKELGDPEVKLWGSERDILKGSIGLKAKVENFLYNRLLINGFRMREKDFRDCVQRIRRFRPVSMWAYVDSVYQLARFVEREKLEVYPIPVTITTAGTLTTEIREYVERNLRTTVFNQYGSREVGPIATECPEREGLHLFEWSQIIEVVDPEGNPVQEGETGEVVVTLLSNFSMPLIRYRIGDTAVYTEHTCSCGRPTKVLADVIGRVTDHFVRQDGTLVHGEYFTHLFYNRGWVKRFQVIQEDYDRVLINLAVNNPPSASEEEEITQQVRAVMGQDCRVEFRYQDRIEPSSSGKYLYTISNVER